MILFWTLSDEFEDFTVGEDAEAFLGKRCAFICQEIKRLQQHSTWLEENLKAATTTKLTRQKISGIKAVLARGPPQASTYVAYLL